MNRAEADAAIERVLTRFFESRSVRPVNLITQLAVFGSYARGAVNPHDVDIHAELSSDDERAEEVISALSRGRDPDAPLRVALRGRARNVQIISHRLRPDMARDAIVLWRTGDSYEQALERVRGIEPNADAGRAPRDAMIDAFAGLDDMLPIAFRQPVADAVAAGALVVEQMVLIDAEVRDPFARRHIDDRWSLSSSLHRAAHAVLSQYENRGISARRVHLHCRDVDESHTPYFAGFQLRYTRMIPSRLAEVGHLEWLEVVRPTRTKPMIALKISPVDRKLVDELRW